MVVCVGVCCMDEWNVLVRWLGVCDGWVGEGVVQWSVVSVVSLCVCIDAWFDSLSSILVFFMVCFIMLMLLLCVARCSSFLLRCGSARDRRQ